MCYGLIEYEFYLPANMTQETWNYYARTFGYGYDGALSTECREAVKRNICQKLYMRCPENVDLDDYATWNYQPMYEGSLIPLPFTRPCKHTCEAVETACAATDPYAIWSGNFDCDEVSSATGVGVYSNKTDECATTLTGDRRTDGLAFQVAENIEPYVGMNITDGYTFYEEPDYSDRETFTASLVAAHERNVAETSKGLGICTGVTESVFTAVWDPLYMVRPYAYMGDPYFRAAVVYSPLMQPFSMQWITEFFVKILHIDQDLALSVNDKPVCRKAYRKFLCGTAFYQGEKQEDGYLAYFLPDFYVEQRPSQQICEDYVEQCKAHAMFGIALDIQMLGNGVENDGNKIVKHCATAHLDWYGGADGNMSWYPNQTETLLNVGLGNVLRGPNHMEGAVLNHWSDNATLCHTVGGINHHYVPATAENTKSNWADSALGMPFFYFAPTKMLIEGEVQAWENWADKVCPKGWQETNPDCPWSYEEHVQSAACLKSCFQFGNYLDPMRDPKIDEAVNVADHFLLWLMFFLMTYMVATWTVFREKAKQRIVLVLSVLMWLQTFIELLGYVIYPTAENRFCENDAVPLHHGFNYCAVSAMLVLGIISPMFQMMIACMALDVYLKVIMNQKNKNHYWKYYTAGSFLVALCFKFIPVFILLEAAGFDGVNACGYTFWLRQPNSRLSPTPVDFINPKYNVDLTVLILMNTVEHFAWVASVVLFTRIIAAVVNSMKRVGSAGGEGESAVASALKQVRLVKTPVLMIFFFTFVSAAQIYLWDVYAIKNWEYFGPGDKPMGKTWYNVDLWSPYYSWLHNRDGSEVAYSQWAELDDLTKVMNYYIKLINHLSFPILLFFVFGTHKDNLKLWLKKFGMEHLIQNETSTGGSSYDWTIVRQNQKLQKLGVKKYFSQLFKSENDMAKVHSVRESGIESAWEGSTMSVAEKESTYESVQEA